MLASELCSDHAIRKCSHATWATAKPQQLALFGLLLAVSQAVTVNPATGHARGAVRPAMIDTVEFGFALQHAAAAGGVEKQAVRPVVARCSKNVKELVRRLEKHYTGVQLENALVSFCITSQEFDGAPRLEDGFESRQRCERYAHKLVAARDAEAEGQPGGYRDFCRAYHGVAAKEEKIKPKVRAAPEPMEGPPEKRTSVWMLVGAGLLLSLLIAACLFCLAGALTRKKPQKPPPPPPVEKDWLTVAREMFERYDVDHSNHLEREEFTKLLDELSTHVARSYNPGGADAHYSREDFRQQLRRELDTDHGGVVSKQVFMANVKSIVEDMD